MNFFNNLFGGRNNKAREKLTANSILKAIQFSKPESRLVIDKDQEIGYLSVENVAYLLTLGPAPTWDFDLRTLDGAKIFYGNQCAEAKGAMPFLELTTVDKAEALRGIFKYRSAGNPLAIAYAGIIWVPFMEGCLQINIEAVEQGTTGMREALVMTMMMDDGTFDRQESFAPPIKVNSAEEMFKRMGETPLRVIASDDAKWDEIIPGHPLSLVRKNLNMVTESLKLAPSMHALKPFRV
ncbi:MAG: hypothetical protein KGS72_24280 [Cyanobacteria bacterium REEB67]|nr:hypothetical protein [Cyanobacteria bacterium REEB67]